MLHALAHIESWAIDLSWDILGRFLPHEDEGETCPSVGVTMPREFYGDWLRVADDECRHHCMLVERMAQLDGMKYGDLPVHEGLWESAEKTSDSLLARLAIVHMVHGVYMCVVMCVCNVCMYVSDGVNVRM